MICPSLNPWWSAMPQYLSFLSQIKIDFIDQEVNQGVMSRSSIASETLSDQDRIFSWAAAQVLAVAAD